MAGLQWLDAIELGNAFRRGAVTPEGVLAHLLARIERLDPELHAFVALRPDGARADAAASGRRFADGMPLGPLDGIPFAVKDVIDVAGMATTCHSAARLKAIACTDADCVAQLRDAGAVLVGKLATHELAIGGPSFDLPFPPARNPWNLAHHPGGSSSGAGAAVAAGLVPLALGTDTAGSTRHPASACGIIGLKPGYDRISRRGLVPLAPSLDHVGLLARSVRDCLAGLDVLAGPVVAALPVRPDLVGVRIGYVRHFQERDMPADPEIIGALDRAAWMLAEVGADVCEIDLSPLDGFAITNRVLLQSEGWSIHGADIVRHPERYAALTRAALLPGALLTPADVKRARQARIALGRAVDAAFQTSDVLLCASSMTTPCRIDDPAAIAATYMRQARTPFNLTGHPALTMPAGRASSGLPLSLQLAANHGREDLLLHVAAVWEMLGGSFSPPPLPQDVSSSGP